MEPREAADIQGPWSQPAREEGKGVHRVHFGSSEGFRPPEAVKSGWQPSVDAHSSGTVPRHHLLITARLSGELLAGVRGLLAEVWLKPGGPAFPMPMSSRGHAGGGPIPELLGQASGRTQASGHRDPPPPRKTLTSPCFGSLTPVRWPQGCLPERPHSGPLTYSGFIAQNTSLQSAFDVVQEAAWP